MSANVRKFKLPCFSIQRYNIPVLSRHDHFQTTHARTSQHLPNELNTNTYQPLLAHLLNVTTLKAYILTFFYFLKSSELQSNFTLNRTASHAHCKQRLFFLFPITLKRSSQRSPNRLDSCRNDIRALYKGAIVNSKCIQFSISFLTSISIRRAIH